jgi:CheY-like chemotaxis protein
MARILVVDDEEAVRSLIARGLELDAHTVEMAGDGAEALEAITARDGQFDLVLSDIRMPLRSPAMPNSANGRKASKTLSLTC